jgi:hypothetical protein
VYNVLYHSSGHPTITRAARLISSTMAQSQRPASPQGGARSLLAAQSIKNQYIKGQRRAAILYNDRRTTINRRLQCFPTIQAFNQQKRTLSSVEEQSLVVWILDLDRRGFPPHIIDVRRMADVLLANRGQDPLLPPVGKCWVNRFISRQSASDKVE